MKKYFYLILFALLISCQGNSQENNNNKKEYSLVKTDAEWKSSLSNLAYNVLRK